MPTMGTLESRFADLIWSHEPMASKDLIKMAEKELNWKSSTSYTVLWSERRNKQHRTVYQRWEWQSACARNPKWLLHPDRPSRRSGDRYFRSSVFQCHGGTV